MPSEDSPDQPTLPPSDDAQRKLWFEYLAKLNDRRLQWARATGFTPWALLAVAAAIIYKGVPQIPTLLSISGGTTATLVILGLEADALLFGYSVVIAAYIRCAPDLNARLLPEHSKRWDRLNNVLAITWLALMAAVHFLAYALSTGPRFTRWVLMAFGVASVICLLTGIGIELTKAHKAKKLKIPLPVFSLSKAVASMGSVTFQAIMFGIAVISVAALLIFLRSLHRASAPWVMPWEAATDLVVLTAILSVLWERIFVSAYASTYLSLERDLILENLSPSEIKARFIREALGPSVGEWLDKITQERQQSLSALVGVVDALKLQVEEIEAIDHGYSIERAGRAQKVREELDRAIDRYSGELRGFHFQLQQVTDASISAEETRILRKIEAEWTPKIDQASAGVSAADELKKRLLALASPPK